MIRGPVVPVGRARWEAGLGRSLLVAATCCMVFGAVTAVGGAESGKSCLVDLRLTGGVVDSLHVGGRKGCLAGRCGEGSM